MSEVVLHILDSRKYFSEVVKIVKKNSKKNLIYVTTNKPYYLISKRLKEKRVKSEERFFIDCISRRQNKDVNNCAFVGGVGSLSTLSIAINSALLRIEGNKTLLLDSLSVLLIYNDARNVARFSNFILNRLRMLGVSTIILALDSDSNKDVLKQVESFADEVIVGE